MRENGRPLRLRAVTPERDDAGGRDTPGRSDPADPKMVARRAAFLKQLRRIRAEAPASAFEDEEAESAHAS